MPYNVSASNISYLSNIAPISAKPLTMACWFRRPLGTVGTPIILFDGANVNRRFGISLGTTGTVAVVEFDTAWASVTTTTTHTANTWNHACATFTSNTKRTPYLNAGGNRDSNGNAALTGVTSMRIGINQNTANSLNGDVAEVGIWNVALTQPEISSLAAGMTCNKVCPQNLVFYAPLVRDLIDVKGGLTITNNNSATVADHPRVYA